MYTPVDRDDLNDLPAMIPGIMTVLRERMRKEMNEQALVGDGTGQNWNGVLPQLSASDQTFDMKAGNKLYSDTVSYVDTIRERGGVPSAYFLGASDKARYYNGFAAADITLPDFLVQPNGAVSGVPIVISAGVPALSGLILDTSPSTIQIVLGRDIEIDTFDQTLAANNQLMIRATAYGNVRFWQPAYGYKLTALGTAGSFV